MIGITTSIQRSEIVPETRLALSSEEPITHQLEKESGDIIVEGWFTTEAVNRMNQIVLASSFDWKEGLSLYNGRVLGFHDQMSTPVGQLEGKIEIVPNRGLRGRVRIFQENADLFMRGITEGVLQAFSIGFQVVTFEFDEETEIVTFTKCRLLENSIVNVGANAEAEFIVVTNDVNTKLRMFKKPDSQRSNAMDKGITQATALTPEAINAMGAALQLPDFKTEQEKQAANLETLTILAHELKEQANNFEKGYITKSDYVERMTKIQNDFELVNADLEKARNQIQMQSERLVFDDYRTMLNDFGDGRGFNWLHHEDGRDFTEVDYRAHALFQLKIDYNKFDRGQELKNLRNLHDAVVFAHALGRHRNQIYNLQNSILFKQLQKGVETFDSVVANAMAGGNAGLGAEWLPVELSAEFNEILRLQPTLSSKFQTWNMPKGASAKYPFQNGKATIYKGGEALVDNADQARKTNIATGAKTFTPFPFIGALLTSQELQEDSIVELVSFIRMELAKASLEALDSAISNGDDTSPHMDNAHNTQWQTYNVETGFKGLRRLGITGASVDTGGTVASLSIDNMLAIKAAMGVAGCAQPASDVIWVTGIKGKYEIKLGLLAEGEILGTPVVITGQLPTIDGSEVVVSEQYLEDQDADGFGAVSLGSGKFTSVCAAHTPSFRIGQRRGVTIETDKDILTQQLQFVSTARWDFGKISADAVIPAGCGINVQHTA